jgi:hypothetical protein
VKIQVLAGGRGLGAFKKWILWGCSYFQNWWSRGHCNGDARRNSYYQTDWSWRETNEKGLHMPEFASCLMKCTLPLLLTVCLLVLL